ncbi:MAG TPA: hypothetical protein VMA35_05930 [Candidatus Sulfopaludibacter sp.]|nr:hypothetical protein [Candidatus Sulfopaludibacter sp.]
MIVDQNSGAWTLKDYSTIILPLVPTLIMVYIAWQQWLTNKLKVQHDLYDRKFAVFTALIDFLNSAVVTGLQPDKHTINHTFVVKTRESHFLFKGNEIPEYLDKVYEKAEAFGFKYIEISNNAALSLNDRNAELNKERSWLREQLKTGAKDQFANHLKLYSHWYG